MTEEQESAFDEAADGPLSGRSDAAFTLDLEGYEGPIDALLQLARDQKVDITRISILALADQYLDFVMRAHKLRLELAADYLVMAAWLAYLKSRLLLPAPTEAEEEPSGPEMAAALRFQLQRLQAMQDAGQTLMAMPRLGRDVFPRGEPAPLRVVATTRYDLSLYELLRAYGRIQRPANENGLRIDGDELYSVDQALGRLRSLLGASPAWQDLLSFLPEALRGGLVWRSAVTATFAASLEMTREGQAEIRQDGPFRPIYVRRGPEHAKEPS